MMADRCWWGLLHLPTVSSWFVVVNNNNKNSNNNSNNVRKRCRAVSSTTADRGRCSNIDLTSSCIPKTFPLFPRCRRKEKTNFSVFFHFPVFFHFSVFFHFFVFSPSSSCSHAAAVVSPPRPSSSTVCGRQREQQRSGGGGSDGQKFRSPRRQEEGERLEEREFEVGRKKSDKKRGRRGRGEEKKAEKKWNFFSLLVDSGREGQEGLSATATKLTTRLAVVLVLAIIKIIITNEHWLWEGELNKIDQPQLSSRLILNGWKRREREGGGGGVEKKWHEEEGEEEEKKEVSSMSASSLFWRRRKKKVAWRRRGVKEEKAKENAACPRRAHSRLNLNVGALKKFETFFFLPINHQSICCVSSGRRVVLIQIGRDGWSGCGELLRKKCEIGFFPVGFDVIGGDASRYVY